MPIVCNIGSYVYTSHFLQCCIYAQFSIEIANLASIETQTFNSLSESQFDEEVNDTCRDSLETIIDQIKLDVDKDKIKRKLTFHPR